MCLNKPYMTAIRVSMAPWGCGRGRKVVQSRKGRPPTRGPVTYRAPPVRDRTTLHHPPAALERHRYMDDRFSFSVLEQGNWGYQTLPQWRQSILS